MGLECERVSVVSYNFSLWHVDDLCRYDASVVHRVEHLVGQLHQMTVDVSDLPGLLTQHRVTEDADGQAHAPEATGAWNSSRTLP